MLADKSGYGGATKNEIISDKELAEELDKSIRKKKNLFAFIDNIRGANLADMQFIIRFDKGFRFLWSVIDIFSKNAWVISFKDKKRYYNY